MEYIRNAHSVYLLTYHIVFVTKYRRPVIDGRISAFLKDHISYLLRTLQKSYTKCPQGFKNVMISSRLLPLFR